MELSGDRQMSRGDWRIWSELDPRWEATGNNQSSQEAQKEAQKAFEKLKQRLGDPPQDMLWMHRLT